MKTRSLSLSILLSALMAFVEPLSAEEGGSGHYLPGAMSSFIDGVAAAPAVVARYNMVYYSGDVSLDQLLPIAGLQAAGADATSWVHGLTLLWRPALDLGERWSYALSATVPFLSLDVAADVATGTTPVGRSSTIDNLGDIVLMPLMLN